MNYIEFNIGKKDRGFKFGLGFLGDIIAHYGTSLTGLGRIMVDNPYSIAPACLYFGHYHDCVRKGLPIDFTIYDAQDWMDELPEPLNDKNVAGAISRVVDTITRYLPKPVDGEDTDDEKKN